MKRAYYRIDFGDSDNGRLHALFWDNKGKKIFSRSFDNKEDLRDFINSFMEIYGFNEIKEIATLIKIREEILNLNDIKHKEDI